MGVSSESHDCDPAWLAANFPENLPLCPWDLQSLSIYMEMLLAWNRKMNLVGRAEPSLLLSSLICDSFHLAGFMEQLYPLGSDPVIWEPGAGAGLPGIPLRLVWATGSYTMIEIREKRAIFLQNVMARVNLPRMKIFRGALEKLHAVTSPQYFPDCIISRAFRPYPELIKLCLPMLKTGGILVILANTPPPQNLPCRVIAERRYPSGDQSRWFWALADKLNMN